ncbi:AAA family ATPase [bacterium]|nr:AAA family ATPase [bacterium]
MSYGNYTSAIQLDKNRLTLIQGDNGAGKTTALLALAYNLFGKTFNKATKANLINKKNKKGMVTRSWFSIGNDNYFIERGEKPSIFRVTCNDKELDVDGDSRDFQKRLENEILQFDLKTFTRLICLGYDYIRFFELTTQERREFIESVLDLSNLSEMSKKIKELYKEDSDLLVKYELNLNGKRSNKEIYEKQFETLSKDNESMIVDYKNKIQSLTDANAELLKKYQDLENESYNVNKEYKDIDALVEENRTKVANIRVEFEKIRLKKNNNIQAIEFYNKHSDCPTCHQKIEDSFRKHTIELLEKENKEFDDNIEEFKTLAKSYNEVIDNFSEQSKVLRDKLQEYNSKISGYKQEIVSNNKLITETKELLNKAENNGNLAEVKANIEEVLKDISDFEHKIDVLNLRIKIYKDTLVILSENGVKKAIIDNYIDIINSKVNEYLEDFGCSFDFSMDSEFDETIRLDFRDDVKYESLSAGQKQRLDLSIFLSFREIAQLRSKSSANILLLDEILDTNLDDDGVSKIIDILLKQDKINILAISHNSTCKELFENVINIKKKKYGFSEIC